MGKLWGLIKLLPTLFGLIKQLQQLWQDYTNKKHAKAKEEQTAAVEKIEEAKTAEEVWKANEDKTRNLP